MIRLRRNNHLLKRYNEIFDKKGEIHLDLIEHELQSDIFKSVNEKCSYCETSSHYVPLELDYYRPVNGSLNVVDGTFYPYHYQWLDDDWDNFIVLCGECNRSKSNRFPVEGNVGRLNATKQELLKERRLLLNPYRDYPERHFNYKEDGLIIPRTKKGQYTIDVLNLNRAKLVEKRKAEYLYFEELCNLYIKSSSEFELENIIQELKSMSAFTGLKRYILTQLIIENRIPYLIEFENFLSGFFTYRDLNQSNDKFYKSQELIEQTFIQKEMTKNNYDVTDDEDLKKYFVKQQYIENIEIRNFKSISHLELNLNLAKSSKAPWLMLLGENGIGKSSILQAIAFALMGEVQRNSMLKHLNKNLNEYLKHGTLEGYIKVKLSGMLEPISIVFKKSENQINGKYHYKPRVLLLGYGATRLLPRSGMNASSGITWARTENLFNPFVPLVDVDDYLSTLNSTDFNIVKSAINSLFLEDVDILRDTSTNNKVYFRFFNNFVKLKDLSDGYQVIIALVTDIMMVMKNRWRSFDAEGIVLIDELDSHLHPRWSIEIVSRLKKVFPKIQFISSTHNPLTLRGLIHGEIAVLLENEKRENFIIQNLPSQKEFNVEELLTSKFFGLYDTTPELNEIFDEYYLLLTNPEPDEDERKKILYLKEKLSNYNKLGTTLREQKFYEAIDIYMASSKKNNKTISNEEFKDTIKQAIKFFEE